MIYNLVKSNTYYDSVTLMLISSQLMTVPGIEEAAVMMGTNHNKELMKSSGILTAKEAEKVTGNDLVIGIKAPTQAIIDQALKVLNDQFANKEKKAGSETVRVKSLEAGVKKNADLNFSVISIPGRFAKNEAMKSLKNGLHVLLFSDNVSLEEEIELKKYAVKNELLMMGPDCGTAIINGVALGFANVVRRGNIGIVAASGTGAQESSVIIDKLGGGISQLIGTGGRDVKKDVGGLMMLQGLEALNQDPQTEVIGIVSKPPYKEVMETILNKVKTFKKPVVACFLGGDKKLFEGTSIQGASTLEEAATLLVQAANKKAGNGAKTVSLKVDTAPLLKTVKKNNGKYVRGLYTGGTLAYESLLILNQELKEVYSNIAIDKKFELKDVEKSQGHTILDMGEDYFTDGAPHPMIDPKPRAQRMVVDAKDPDTAVILFDCVLGYGSHADPAESIVNAIHEINDKRANKVVFIGSVCGTDADPQNRAKQEEKLRQAGAIVFPTNAQAAQFTVQALKGLGV